MSFSGAENDWLQTTRPESPRESVTEIIRSLPERCSPPSSRIGRAETPRELSRLAARQARFVGGGLRQDVEPRACSPSVAISTSRMPAASGASASVLLLANGSTPSTEGGRVPAPGPDVHHHTPAAAATATASAAIGRNRRDPAARQAQRAGRDQMGDVGGERVREPPQLGAQLVGGLVAIVAVARHGARDDRADGLGHGGVDLVHGRRRLGHRRHRQLQGIGAVERPPSAEQLVEHDAEAVDVVARIGWCADELFGRGVARRAHHLTGNRDRVEARL